jgi:hypothetical protein
MTRATDARMTEAEVKAREISEKQKAAEGKKLQKAFCECFATESGKIVLKWLMDQCSYQRPLIVANPQTGESLNTTLYAEGRRTLYLRMRKFLHRDILAQVELGGSEGGDGSEELLT